MNAVSFIKIPVLDRPFDKVIRIPGSKSITNRALLIAALASGTTTLKNVLFSDDTEYMINALSMLGIGMDIDRVQNEITVQGKEGILENPGEPIFIGNSGTCARFLTTAVTLGEGDFVIDGNERMRQRPIQDLVDGLKGLGVDIETENDSGCPPLLVHASGLHGGVTNVSGATSSQYLSSILLSAPYASGPITILINGKLVSRPYVVMSTRMMQDFGARVEWNTDNELTTYTDVKYLAKDDYIIESDYSSASYFGAAATLTGSHVKMTLLPKDSLQGDKAFLDILQRMGAKIVQRGDVVEVTGTGKLRGISVDMFDCSDLVPTVAVLAAFAEGTTRITNVENIRVKESDRIAVLATELQKIGANIIEYQDGLEIRGDASALHGASIETYDDHRVAMSFSVAGLKIPGIAIENPSCVAKTYPAFFDEFMALLQ
ncbi:MAG TPA: 3-phosphoshikimate 1-carboxyvinyltransferase [Candidatus Lokiarchaeia archaeon]|nr:3-phosphoshikimate 1-carboxyvinyltransferase [Candidatus Lokiarchaeia archaeon]